jgi:rhodanese-related sulfurtransferase
VKRLLLQMVALVALACVAGALSNAVRAKLAWRGNDPLLLQKQVERVGVDEAARLQDDPRSLFLDVRPRADFERGRIRGALSFAADSLDAAYAGLRDFLGPEIHVVIYGEETLPAIRGAEYLKARGHAVRVLEGGWRAWAARALPQEAEAKP